MKPTAAPTSPRISADRIRERLSVVGKTAAGASLEAGLSRDAIRNILRGLSMNATTNTMMRLAKVLDCSIEYLAGLDPNSGPGPAIGRPGIEPQFEFLPVLHEVGAGYWLEAPSGATGEYGPVGTNQRYAGFSQWLERVIGTGADSHFQAGELTHVVDAEATGYKPLVGDHVIVERWVGGLTERSIRLVQSGRDGVLSLVCPTDNPRFSAVITWPSDGSWRIVGKVIGRYSAFD